MRHVQFFSVGLLTFVLGIGAFLLYFDFKPIPSLTMVELSEIGSAHSTPFYGVCELMNPRKSFNGKEIYTEATIYEVDDKIAVYPISFCTGDADAFVWVQLDLKDYVGPNQDLKYLLPDRKPMSEIDVRIYGRVVEKKGIVHDKMNVIIPTKIELISPWRKFEPKGAA